MKYKLTLFDSHFHIIDKRFPLVSNNDYLPSEFTCENYLTRMQKYNLCGGAVVSGSYHGFDQTYLLGALKKLGTSFVGVTHLPASASEKEILKLNNAGVRAIRFNLKRGGSEDLRYLDSMARRVHELVGWHVELYVDAKELKDFYKVLVNLPLVSIDHLGLTSEGFSTLLKLVENGAHVKASGFGRVDFDVHTALCKLHSANPQSLMFGTDLPSTRALRPFNDDDFNLVVEALGSEQAINVLYKNAMGLYKPNIS